MEDNTDDNVKELELLIRLSKNEGFQTWVKQVVDPLITVLEADLASEKADQMDEAVLRGKLKQVNSLKYLFKDVFEQVHSQLREE